MKKVLFTLLLSFGAFSLMAQTDNHENTVTPPNKYSEETHIGHNHGPEGVKGCDPELLKKVQEISKNGTCPALEDYVFQSTGKKFFQTYPDFPTCPNLGNYILDKEAYHKSIKEWMVKHPDDAELVNQILGNRIDLAGIK